MLTIRLLGTASIEAPHTSLSGRAAQGRRLALLAQLALARGRSVSRDKLIAVLWPEASPDRARPLLSDTLYILRRGLGEDVVRATGDLLALNPDAVTSDVALFEQALAEGRLEQAVGLYAGPLLDGFHIADSAEFEEWLDGERAELDRLYADALEKLAVAAEAGGAHFAALEWWRRLAAHDPYNGRVALRLMHALEATGDRPGALQHARIHAALLRNQLDAEPDADVAAYAERLRLEPAAKLPLPAPPRAVTVPPAGDPESDHGGPTAEGPARSRSRRKASLAFALAALSLVAAVVILYGARGSASVPPGRSIGVLPFVNMSPDPANTYFSDGLSEQIILALSRVEGLRVAARTSSFALRDQDLDVRAIGDTLDVQAVLEGSLLVNGDRLRVIAQLIDARTGYHMWSEQYDTDVRDVFAVQDSIAAAIARALHLRLAGEGSGSPGTRTPSPEAYDLYLRGLYLREGLSGDGLRRAAEYFDRVIELEPSFAQAIAAKATVVAPMAYFGHADRDSVVSQLRLLTARTLELDPNSSEGYVALGILKLFFEWDRSGAGAAFERAVELNPNDAHAWHQLANYYRVTGSFQDAVRAREKAVQLDPLNARTRVCLSRDLLIVGDYERALDEGRRAAQLDPLNPLILGKGPGLPEGTAEVLLAQDSIQAAVDEYLRLAMLRGASADELQAMREAHASEGMPGFWRAWLAMDLRQSGASPDPVRMAAIHLVAGDTARALDWVDRAFAERNPALVNLRSDPVLSGLNAHPRAVRIAGAMKLQE